MDFAFSAEQDDLRATVRQFFANKSPEAEVRRLMASDDGFDPAMWSRLGTGLGVLGLAIPEEFGGAGYGFIELGVLIEEAGRSLACLPLLSSVVLAANTILLSADDSAQRDYLPGLADGSLRGTLALAEDTGRWDVESVELSAVRGNDGWQLTGHKSYVLDGHTADLVLVAARTPAGVGVFAVDAGAEGLRRTLLPTMDQTRKQARLEFDAVSARAIGDASKGADLLSRVLDLAAVALAAEQVGGAGRVLEMAVDYAKVRKQFGRPIGSFQAVKHKCADMLLEVESSRSAAYYALWAASELNDELPAVASLAKAYCSDAFFHCTAENIQIHGGIGFTWEHPAHLYFKRAKTSQLLFGDPTYHRELFAQRSDLAPA